MTKEYAIEATCWWTSCSIACIDEREREWRDVEGNDNELAAQAIITSQSKSHYLWRPIKIIPNLSIPFVGGIFHLTYNSQILTWV